MPYGRGHRLTKEECQRRVFLVSPNIEIVEYKSAAIPVKCRCRQCGNEWCEPSKNLYRGSNCPACTKRKKNNWDTESFIEAVMKINDKIALSGTYSGSYGRWQCKCAICGHEWTSYARTLLVGHGCNICAHAFVSKQLTKSHEQFVNELQAVQPSLAVIGHYKNAKTPVKCRCAICGHMWNAQPTNLLQGYGCPECKRITVKQKQLKPHSQFVADIHRINPDIDVVSEYKGARDLIQLRCSICGEVWSVMASNAISHACGCPTCNASHGEKAIAAHLRSMGITYVPQHRFPDLVGVGGVQLSYDFYIPDLNVLIEFQGQYHDGTVKSQTAEQLTTQIEHDRRKRKYADDNGLRLIEIWYYNFTRIKEILETSMSSNATTVVA